jgi:hypothetical protein
MSHIQLVDIRLHIGNERLEIGRRKILAREDQHWCAGHKPDRRKINVRLVGKVRIERDRSGVRAHVPHDDGVAIRAGAHGPRRGGGAAGTHDVLDDELLAERARHVLGRDACNDIGGSAGGERHDHGDRAAGIIGLCRHS